MPFSVTSVIICIVIGLVIGFMATGILRSSLKSVDFKQEATSYRELGNLNVTNRKDVFLYKKLDKTPIPKDKPKK